MPPLTRAQRGFTLVEILVVLAILAALMGLVASNISRGSAASKRLVCANNLHQFGAAFVERSVDKGLGPRDGQGLLLGLLRDGSIRQGDERVFLCKADPAGQNADDPAFVARYASADLDHPDPALCSYAVRNRKVHPFRIDGPVKEPLVLCPWHHGGVQVLYDDGTVTFVTLEALGLPPEATPVLGPGGNAELLRKFDPVPR